MLQRLYSWYGKKTVLAITGVFVVLVIAGVVTALKVNTPEETPDEQLPLVKVATVTDIASQNSISLIGTVRAVNEAQIQSENAGRVTSVSVSLGQAVSAGQILGQQENAAQRASVLQAEGAYEATLASAQQSGVSLNEAENTLTSAQNSLISTNQSAYTTVTGILVDTIDDFFTNPESTLPGLRISGNSYTQTLNNERFAFNQMMATWKNQVNRLNLNDDIQAASQDSQDNINRVLTMVDILIELVNIEDSSATLQGAPITSYNSILLSNRAALTSAHASLQAGMTAVASAQEAVTKAEIGGGSQSSSAANAQIKQALGSLRAAQANLEKTFFRTPIAGTLNSLSIHVGDYLSAFTKIAEVANNNALEISTFVGASDLSQISIGDTVRIENSFNGVVTQIAPGIDSVTQKSEIKIATETAELTNGDTVSISLSGTKDATTSKTILLPITAVKFSAENGSVFTVTNNELVSHEIEIGNLRGSYVEVQSGVTSDMEIVVDARGLTAGGRVTVTQ